MVLKIHAGSWMPEPVFSNVGKLLLATQIYDMHRIAHEVSGGLIVALPGLEKTIILLRPGIWRLCWPGEPTSPYDQRKEVARFPGDITASSTGGWYSVISLHGAVRLRP